MMASPNGVTIRSATEDDWPQINELIETCFGFRNVPEEIPIKKEIFPIDRALVAVDDGRIVGHTADRHMTLTVPGERIAEVCGVSGVVVAPTHRRRGILRSLYTELHQRVEDEGLPLTVFTASEGTIYGRFGYGPSMVVQSITIDRTKAVFRSTTPDPGGVRMESPAAARPHVEEIYDRWRRLIPGAQVRPAADWNLMFTDSEAHRHGATSLFALTHPDGYALYRRDWRENDQAVAIVTEFRAVTPEAHIALWRVLLSLDLVGKVEADIAPDDPLPYLLTDPRLVKPGSRWDGLWTRLMDVPAALGARDYATDLDLVVAVEDPFRDAGGNFALRVRDGVPECESTTRTPDIELGIDVLGSLYFGAHRARVFAAANRIQAKDPDVLRAFDAAFVPEREPQIGWFF
ncbi:GNAT family N-acetyltransferase [Nocardia inohanensis]|uniref:GNAT family N-acetyltransferase n=1 Tax=Nocardia inohanensis TaxID=209246 RepID=UPI00082A2378|nr:GNAT family N-acetyltransferase [Nocardia inohanensis]